jgi:hypothetical protein
MDVLKPTMSVVERLAVVVLMLVGTSLPVAGQIRDLEFGASDFNAFNSLSGSQVARLADGSYAVAWQGTDQEIRLQWVRPDGSEALESGGRLLARPTSLEFPVVVAHPVSGAFVAFSTASANARVVVQSFDGNGSPRWSGDGVVALDSPGTEYQSRPRLLANADGGVFVCLSRSATSAAPAEIVCQRLDAGGRPLWAGGRGSGSSPGGTSTPSLVTDGLGGALVFWTNSYLAPSGGSKAPRLVLQGQHYSPSGNSLWGARGKQLHTTSWFDPTFQSSQQFVVSDGRGGAILAFPDWNGQGPPVSISVLAQRVNHDGTALWGKTGIVIENGPGFPTLDSLTAAPSAGAFAVIQNQDGLGNGRNQLVLHQLGSGRLLKLGQGVVLSAPGRSQSDNGSQASFDGNLLRILWSSHVLGDTYHVEVRMAVFSQSGQRLTAPDAAPLAAWGPAEGHYLGGFAFDAARNQGLAVWNTWRNIASRLTVDGEGALFSGDFDRP